MLFFQEQYKYLSAAKTESQTFIIGQFANQELHLQLLPDVYQKRCIVVGSLTAPQGQALQLLFLLAALADNGASQIVLFSPYLGYSRQDLHQPGRFCALKWAGLQLASVGVTRLSVLEPHNYQSLSLLGLPVITHSSQIFFQQELIYFVGQGFTFIFPDSGAVERYDWITQMFAGVDKGFFEKKRDYNLVNLTNFKGKVSRKVIIYDDILDSGQTLLQICITLQQMGVVEIVIFVTHGFFSGTAWNDLWQFGVKALYCTDSVPASHKINHPNIYIKSIITLLQK